MFTSPAGFLLNGLLGQARSRVRDAADIRKRTRSYVGGVTVKNQLTETVRLSFFSSVLSSSKLLTPPLRVGVVEPGQEHTFDFCKSSDFDFWLSVDSGKACCCVLRGLAYEIHIKEGEVVVEALRSPQRRKTDLLVNTPGVSFTFSGSGWLLAYHLGACECLQNHGIARNPYVRVAGCSGGALAATSMMLGCDLSAMRDQLKARAREVHNHAVRIKDARSFVFEALKSVVRDGSIDHPVFQSGRLEISVSESGFEVSQGLFSRLEDYATGKRAIVRSRRVSAFRSAAEVVVTLLASASNIVAGMPLNWTSEDDEEVKVLDGGLTDFMPAIDENSVTVMPFSCRLDFRAKKPDVAPTEFVPFTSIVWPPKPASIEHLYELGYQDMEAWLELHLAERIQKVSATTAPPDPELPLVEFECTDNGMTWVEEVLRIVPISWSDQLGTSLDWSAAHGAGSPSRIDDDEWMLREFTRRAAT
mmetsp:Transcript_57735/g.160973  ORF Transcript_57735/g.160973 Transcript_57735/m.160973 type:complete len:474 (+) Transcript_57735:153-1574(+)